jgi:hypothetical protein
VFGGTYEQETRSNVHVELEELYPSDPPLRDSSVAYDERNLLRLEVHICIHVHTLHYMLIKLVDLPTLRIHVYVRDERQYRTYTLNLKCNHPILRCAMPVLRTMRETRCAWRCTDTNTTCKSSLRTSIHFISVCTFGMRDSTERKH